MWNIHFDNLEIKMSRSPWIFKFIHMCVLTVYVCVCMCTLHVVSSWLWWLAQCWACGLRQSKWIVTWDLCLLALEEQGGMEPGSFLRAGGYPFYRGTNTQSHGEMRLEPWSALAWSPYYLRTFWLCDPTSFSYYLSQFDFFFNASKTWHTYI